MKKEIVLFILISLILITSLIAIISSEGSDSSSATEWLMFGRTLNHSFWDGNNFSTILGLNNANFTTLYTIKSSPAVANGYVYLGTYEGNSGSDHNFYQLNASNVSQQIGNFTGTNSFSSSVVANGYVYVEDINIFYQLNAHTSTQRNL